MGRRRANPDTRYLIYGLVHPITGELRYIGKSSRWLIRPGDHGRPAYMREQAHLPVIRWVKKLQSLGLKYNIEVLEYCTRETLDDCENRKMDYWKSFPEVRLLNLAPGAPTALGYKHTQETKDKMSRSKKSMVFTPEHRAKISAAKMGHEVSAEARQKMSDSRKGVRLSEEHRAKIGDSLRGRIGKPHTKETIERMSKAKLGKKASEEAKANISKSKKGKPLTWKNRINIGLALTGRVMPEETKRKISEVKKQRFAERKAAKAQAELEAAKTQDPGPKDPNLIVQ